MEWIPGELLIASDEGLTSYNIVTGKGETLRSDYRQTNGLNDNYLQTLFVDHEQALWVGTYFGGVNYIPPTGNSFIHYYRGNTQLDARIISVFAQADQDNLWLGTDDAGFFYWDRKKIHLNLINLNILFPVRLIIIFMLCYRMVINCISECIWADLI